MRSFVNLISAMASIIPPFGIVLILSRVGSQSREGNFFLLDGGLGSSVTRKPAENRLTVINTDQ